jgi:dienelactone hydrolase
MKATMSSLLPHAYPARALLATLTLAALATAGMPERPSSPTVARQDRPKDLKPGQADLGTLFPQVQKLAQARQYEWSFLSGRFKSFPEFQTAARAKVFEVLLYRPEKVAPQAEVLERVDCGDYIRETVLFNTSPVFRVPAYVLIPKGLKGPAPAIIDLHSHGGMFLFGMEKVVDLGDGKNHPAMTAYHKQNYDGRPTATALVRRGYVVIVIDALMFGERRVLLDGDLKYGWDRSKYTLDDVKYLNQQCRSKEATLVKALTLAGATWPGIVFWDDIRTVDYLVSRPEVDPKRIGCLGISMGGYRALYLSALDERIRAGCVVGFMSSVRPMIQAHLDTHSWVHFLPALHQYLDLPDVASLTAPRALLVQQCSKDRLFPPAGMKESVEKITAVYEKAGARDKFDGRFYDVPHQFTLAMQDEAFAWLDRQLQHQPGGKSSP